ncbi:HAD family hydrolase [Candidatus Saccharibacteria bacterium RIFCSPHIGHO2_12_FULL_42_8]|nr:MAG: HAD family hydrolase [Candidatus Saccharibacteria bacterium RIFCSPHIGHO2_12_FULL_42_8]
MSKKLIAFDLDDTLAITKSPMNDRMSELLVKLLEKYEVCIISGGKYGQFKTQVLEKLATDHLHLRKLHLMPTCGTRYYRYDEIEDSWKLQYAEDLSDKQKQHVIDVLEKVAKELGVWRDKTWGPIIEDRGSQITYSALGQLAPPEEKYKWAEENAELKKEFRSRVAIQTPELEVRLGGSTSIDITRPGIDKAYGMNKLITEMQISRDDVLFIGDRLEEGGNDYPVKVMGIDTIAVEKWQETALIIETICKV